MGLRVWRRVRIAPGLTVNLSRRGASVSAGGRGHWLTAGRRGLRGTVGIPGTCGWYTARLHPRSAASSKFGPAFGCLAYFVIFLLVYRLISSWCSVLCHGKECALFRYVGPGAG